jgi:hypothetical protein
MQGCLLLHSDAHAAAELTNLLTPWITNNSFLQLVDAGGTQWRTRTGGPAQLQNRKLPIASLTEGACWAIKLKWLSLC